MTNHNTVVNPADYFVTMIQDKTPVMSFIVAGAINQKDAEELSLGKYPKNPLTNENWTDVIVQPTSVIDPYVLVRAFVLSRKTQK